MDLEKYSKVVKSQNGEDGIIEEIFNRIGTHNKICVEIGAWDGVYLSNTWNLWHNEQWQGVLIEAAKEKITDLKKNTEGFEAVKIYNKKVSFEGENTAEKIFREASLPEDIDFISIDIDGDDYYIMESMVQYRPRVICIEYNPTIPPTLDIVQGKGEYFGASAKAIVDLAHKMKYKLIYLSITNVFLLREEDFELIGFEEPKLRDVFPDYHLVYVITAYDGTPYLSGELPFKPKLSELNHTVYSELGRKEMIKILMGKKRKRLCNKSHPKILDNNNIIPIEIFKK